VWRLILRCPGLLIASCSHAKCGVDSRARAPPLCPGANNNNDALLSQIWVIAKATALGWVAAEHHAAFEELLAEVQTTYQLRDERCAPVSY
jgi:hypothetical protein